MFPLFPKKIDIPWKIFLILPFPEKNFDFHLPKFLTFLLQNFNFPYFPCFTAFPPYFTKIIVSPYFKKFTCFLHTLYVFRIPLTLTMMHLCITQCTYWMPLPAIEGGIGNGSWMLF